MQPMIIPDYAMTKHDYTGLAAHAATNRDRHIAAKGRMFPARHARGFICIEIIGRRGIGSGSGSFSIHGRMRILPGVSHLFKPVRVGWPCAHEKPSYDAVRFLIPRSAQDESGIWCA